MSKLKDVLAAIEAQQAVLRRFKWRHPVLYWKWRKTPAGRQYAVNMVLLRDGGWL